MDGKARPFYNRIYISYNFLLQQSFNIYIFKFNFNFFLSLQIAVIYFLLLFFLKLIDFRVINLIITIFSFITYILYLKNLNDFEGRSEWLLNNIDSIVETFLTNTLSGFVTLFLWLWIPIFKVIFIKIKILNFFTIDHCSIRMYC